MRRLLLILACVVVAAAIVAPAALIWSALFTTAGLEFVVRHIPQQLGPVQLIIRGVSGTVAGGLKVERVEIDHELVHLTFEGIEGRVALAPLMLQNIRVIRGRVRSALIEVKRRTTPPTPGPPTFLPRWLMISPEEAHVDRATLTVYNGFRMEGRDIIGAAVIRHSRIRFFQATVTLEGAHVDAIGDLLAEDPLGMRVKGHVDWVPDGQPHWTLEGSARGNLDALNIVAHLESPFRADVTGQALDLTDRWHLVGDAVVQDFNLTPWGVNSPLGRITGRLTGSYDEQGFTAKGALNPTGLRAGEFETRFTGHYAQHVLTVQRMDARHVASGARASASGTIAIVDNGPRLDLSGDWDDFRWPLTGREIAVRSAAGAFTLAGVLPYTVHLTGSARAADLPVMPVDVRGTLGKDSFAFDTAEVDLFGGHASVSGSVVWSPVETWSVSGRVTGIDPSALQPDLPGSVSLALDASGRGFDARGEFSASVSGLTGKLRGLPASGAGTVTHAGPTWGFSDVRVVLGTTSLALDGHVDERLDLRFALATRDLSLLATGAQGTLKASGSVSGTLADPAITATAHGSDLEYQGVTLATLDADVNFNPAAIQQESRVDVRLHQLGYQRRTLETVVLSLRGPPTAYDLQLTAVAAGLAVTAQARGPYAHGTLNGHLEALKINGSEQLHLSLERPVELVLSPAHARVDWLCLVGTPGSMCADADWTAAAWSATVMANELPLHTLTAGMTPAVEYLGTVSALARLSGGATTPVQGTLNAQLADAAIDHRLASHKIGHTRIGSGTITATATPALISAQVELGEGGIGTIRGRLEVQRTNPPGASPGIPIVRWQDMPLSGELHARTSDLDLITLYVADIDRAAGGLDADIQLAGTLGAPRVAGLIKVDDGEIDIYQVNLGLHQIMMQARLSDAGIDFTGSAHAGKGAVAASGHLEWRNLLPYGKFHLEGSDLRVADVPEARIDASPDLDFIVTGRKIEVSGKVTVPYAKIQPKDITSAVRASPDEVIVSSDSPDTAKHFEVESTITLVLGDHVNLDAMGLTARLTGSVTIRSGFDAITRGNGELSVAEGNYLAYARKLDIVRGRLLFGGGPIDDPGIDVRAQKQFPDVTAGVNVRGTLTQPHISFFSDPPLPQSQIASLILAGGSLQSTQNSSNAALGQGAALVAAELGSHVGLPDVSLETDPLANETSLVLGHYLSPRLYVSYGVSLTEQLNVFKMRYTLGDHWTIRTEAGTAYGADLVYTIERN
ncbi:MAG TPA: translocation/assembly module TamB domain-containing protein [Steroidobacteraceae bacterium]|nr:translocation/assembly module TamB domain-containing protein [Steroidobacteraceae bacterium]